MAQVLVEIVVPVLVGVANLHNFFMHFPCEVEIHEDRVVDTLQHHSLKLVEDDRQVGGDVEEFADFARAPPNGFILATVLED